MDSVGFQYVPPPPAQAPRFPQQGWPSQWEIAHVNYQTMVAGLGINVEGYWPQIGSDCETYAMFRALATDASDVTRMLQRNGNQFQAKGSQAQAWIQQPPHAMWTYEKGQWLIAQLAEWAKPDENKYYTALLIFVDCIEQSKKQVTLENYINTTQIEADCTLATARGQLVPAGRSAGQDHSTDNREEPESQIMRAYSSAVADFLAGGDALESDDEETLEEAPETDVEPPVAPRAVEAPETEPLEPRAVEACRRPEELQDFLADLRRRPLPQEFTEEKMKNSYGKISGALLSLYRDRIRPFLPAVERRIKEKGGGDVLVEALLQLCAREPGQYTIVLAKEGEQFQILLAKDPQFRWFAGWVDLENPDGEYSKDVWEEMSTFLKDENVVLPGQPYFAALELKKILSNPEIPLPAVEKLCLGELEHVVRIALGSRKLLAMEGHYLRPAHVLADDDTGSQPSTKQETNTSKAADTNDIVIRCPKDLAVVILHLMRKHPNGILLGRLRDTLKSDFGCTLDMEVLCPSVLGRPTLLEVFKLSPLSEIFPLELLQIGHVRTEKNTLLLPPRHDKIPHPIWYEFYHGSCYESCESVDPRPVLAAKSKKQSETETHVTAVPPKTTADRGPAQISIANATLVSKPNPDDDIGCIARQFQGSLLSSTSNTMPASQSMSDDVAALAQLQAHLRASGLVLPSTSNTMPASQSISGDVAAFAQLQAQLRASGIQGMAQQPYNLFSHIPAAAAQFILGGSKDFPMPLPQPQPPPGLQQPQNYYNEI